MKQNATYREQKISNFQSRKISLANVDSFELYQKIIVRRDFAEKAGVTLRTNPPIQNLDSRRRGIIALGERVIKSTLRLWLCLDKKNT